MNYRSIFVKFPFQNKDRWAIIEKSLNKPFTKCESLREKIYSYSEVKSNFIFWTEYFNKCNREERSELLSNILPGIASLCLKAPSLFPTNMEALSANKNQTITLSKLQTASLLANGFFCAFDTEKDISNRFNFIGMFGCTRSTKYTVISTPVERLRCIMNYFRRILTNLEIEEFISISRIVVEPDSFPDIISCNQQIPKIDVKFGSIGGEESSEHLLVDFADENIGGLILSSGIKGLLQEEVLFLNFPEMIVSALLCERIKDNEAILFIGPEKYNKHTGYASTFQWAGNNTDTTYLNDDKHRKNYVLAIDAVPLGHDNITVDYIKRDIFKAYIGFSNTLLDKSIPIATGHWGCGAFKWSKEIKAVIQIISSGLSNRSICYFLVEKNDQFYYEFRQFIEWLDKNKITVSSLYRALIRHLEENNFTNKMTFDQITEIIKNI